MPTIAPGLSACSQKDGTGARISRGRSTVTAGLLKRGASWLLPLLPVLLSWTGAVASPNYFRAGASLYFDGADDYATVLSGFQLVAEWTLEAWVLPADPVAVGQCIIGLQTLSSRNLLTITSTQDRVWEVLYGIEEQPIPHRAWLFNGGGDYSASLQHVAISHTLISNFQSRLELYLNGTLHARWIVEPCVPPEPSLPLLLGACHARSRQGPEGASGGAQRERHFGGHVDELRWWGVALAADEVATSWRWSGPPTRWPPEPFAGETSEAAVSKRAAALRAQHSFDIIAPQVHEVGGLHGWLGGAMHAPRYVASPFGEQVMYGSVFFTLRARRSTRLNFDPHFVRGGIFVLSTEVYNGMLLVRGPSSSSVSLRAPTGGAPLTAGDLVAGLMLQVTTGTEMLHVDFAVQPCAGTTRQPVQLVNCVDEQLYEVTLSIAPSTAPVAGPSHALQLARQGGLMRLPELPQNVTIEFWFQLTGPLVSGATLLSMQEALQLWLRPAVGGAVLEACVVGKSEPVRLAVPGLASTERQHLAVSFEHAAGSGYTVTVHRNCQLVLRELVGQPCSSLDKIGLGRATIGQAHAQGGLSSGADFAAMYLAELRVWNSPRSTVDLCAAMHERLLGNEEGLVAYAPVTAADLDAVGQGARSVSMARTFGNSGNASAGLQAVEVSCLEEFDQCPDVSIGVGFAIRHSNFDLPPEVVQFGTEVSSILTFSLAAHDPDNYEDHSLQPADQDPLRRHSDTLRFEILSVPDPVCGYVYSQGDAFRIPDEEQRRQYGLPPTTLLEPFSLPLRFVPLQGASPSQVAELQGACTSEMHYQVLDSLGLRSVRTATVRLSVWRSGVTLDGVDASDPSGLGTSRLLRFFFSGNTSESTADPRKLLEVVNGTWGGEMPRGEWVKGGSVFLVELAGGMSKGALIPGTTRFRVRASARLLVKGDALSAPSESLSPLLVGDFRNATCVQGAVLNVSLGECEACTPGSFWSVAPGAGCLPCPNGQFSDLPAALSCQACAPGRYMPQTASSRTACLAAPEGNFVASSNESEAEPCLFGAVAEEPGLQECEACPASAVCGVGNQSVALPGHFRAADGHFAACRLPKACEGGNACAPGTAEPALGCYPCAAGWTRAREGAQCRQCPSFPVTIVVGIAFLLLAALLAVYLARLNVTGARHPACLHPYVLKIGLSHLFMMHSFAMIEERDLEPGFKDLAPPFRRTMETVLAWDGMLPLSAIPLDCLLHHVGTTGVARLWTDLGIAVAFPFALILLLLLPPAVLLWLQRLSQCCRRSRALDSAVGDSPGGSQALSAIVPVWTPPTTAKSRADALRDPRVCPVGWEAFWSEAHGRYYYHNQATGQSTWHQPVQPRPPSTRSGSKGRRRPGSATPVASRASSFAAEPSEHRLLRIWRSEAATASGSWSAQLEAFAEDSLGVALAVLALAFPPVLRQLMVLLRCDRLDGQARRLLVAPELFCGGDQQLKLAFAAWSATLCLGFGLPGFCFWLTWRARPRLRSFSTRVCIGVVSAEYEPEYYYWESLVLLRRFAVVAATTLAAPLELRLVLLLGIGNVAAFMNHTYEPFDNRSGVLLDTLESRGLKLFCATAAVMLLSVSGVAHPESCAALAFALLACHVLFLLLLCYTFLRFLRRAIAEGVVGAHLNAEDADPPAGSCRRRLARATRAFRECVFALDVWAQRRLAQATYDATANELVLRPGPAGVEVKRQEQLFVAHGLAGCVAHSISEYKVERLSVHFLEYLARQAFAMSFERLQCTKRVHELLSAGASVGSHDWPASPSSAFTPQIMGDASLFQPRSFSLGMATADLQGALNNIAHCPRDHMDRSFHAFMLLKGVEGAGYHLTPHERMITMFVAPQRHLALKDGAETALALEDKRE